MTEGPLTVDAFSDHPHEHNSALDHEAEQVTAAHSAVASEGLLVLALHPSHPNRRVVASAGNSAIRAAVSVAVAAGNTRAWADAKQDAVVDVDIRTLPEIIRAAVMPAGITTVRVGSVGGDAGPDCLAMWLTANADDPPGADAERADVLARLTVAAAIDRERRALVAARAQPIEVPVGPDPLSRMLDESSFDDALAQLSSDQTGLVVLSIDDVDQLADVHGPAGVEAIVSDVARRLAEASRKTDLLARLGTGMFVVVLVDLDRPTAFEVARRMRSVLAEPVLLDTGTVTVDFSVGLDHEVGLIDPVELYESAASAMREASGSGGGRMVVAS